MSANTQNRRNIVKDRNENPLPSRLADGDWYTIRDFLSQQEHPAEDIDRDSMRFGQKVFEAYKRLHGRNPYTLRIGMNGPVKVYTGSDRRLILECYTRWMEMRRRQFSVVKDAHDGGES